MKVDNDILLAVANNDEEAALLFLNGIANEGGNARITAECQQAELRRRFKINSYIAFLPILTLRLVSLEQRRCPESRQKVAGYSDFLSQAKAEAEKCR